ncbi:hypothetical protein OIU78_007434 [Salix suchowensis]|nr:hypothetical protein OIU78_007434 [Salix suchowensis]
MAAPDALSLFSSSCDDGVVWLGQSQQGDWSSWTPVLVSSSYKTAAKWSIPSTSAEPSMKWDHVISDKSTVANSTGI